MSCVMAESTENTLVLVTGATSYIAGNVIKVLQEEGYSVRGVVDDLGNEEQVKALQDLNPEHSVDVISADLLKPEEWEAAVKGVTYVIHSVSPFQQAPSGLTEEDITKRAVEGTQNVLKACVASKMVKRVVLTSSLSTIGTAVSPDHKQLTEADWATNDKGDAWIKSKTAAEQAAWDYIKELPDDDKIEISVINAPSYILGAVKKLDHTSTGEVIKRLMERSLLFVPKISMAVMDAKDLATAHFKAMTVPEAAGNRHIVFGHVLWLKEVAQHLNKEFRPQGFNVPTVSCPHVALRVTAIFDKKNKIFLPQAGKMISYDNTRMKDVLGITARDVKESLVEMATSMIDSGLIVKKVKKQRAPKEKPEKVDKVDVGAGDSVEANDEKPTENGEVQDEADKQEHEKKDAEEDDIQKPEKIEDVADKTQEEKTEDKPVAVEEQAKDAPVVTNE